MVRHRFSAAKLDARADDGNTVSGEPSADSRARSLSTDDQQTSKRLRRTRGAPSSPAGPDEDEDEEDEEDEDDSEAELLAQVKKLDTRPPPTPARASRRQNVKRVEDSESDELHNSAIHPSLIPLVIFTMLILGIGAAFGTQTGTYNRNQDKLSSRFMVITLG
jgi:hypothetical protein